MNTQDAEERLQDYLYNGIATEIHWADQAYALAVEIGKHAEQINTANFGVLFGSLQDMLSERQTLAVTKLFDRPKLYPVRSIPGTLALLERHAQLWRIPERGKIYEALSQGGTDTSRLEQLGDDELTRIVVEHFRSTLPDKEAALRQSRDKQIAHNEAIEPSALKTPTWGEALSLIDYAKNFLTTIGYGYLRIFFGVDSSDYHVFGNSKRMVDDLRRLLIAAGISEGR